MKKILLVLALVAAVSGYSQGTVNFVTRDVGNGVNCRVVYYPGGPITTANTYPDANVNINGTGFGGVNAMIGLYGAAEGASTLQLLGVAVPFFSGTYRGYANAGSDTARILPGVPGGALAEFQVRVWDVGVSGYANYEDAFASGRPGYFGQSAVLHNIVLGNYTPPGGTPTPSAALTGLNGGSPLVIGIPEPSIIGLGLLGAVAGLLVCRRRS